MRKWLVTAAALLLILGARAFGDYTATQGAGTTFFDFTCFTTKHCTAFVPINSAGTEIFTAAAPAQVTLANTGANATAVKVDGSAVTQPVSSTALGITAWGGSTIGAMANYGTSPGAVLVPGVNAFITNTNANGTATAANSSPVVPAISTTLGWTTKLLNCLTNAAVSIKTSAGQLGKIYCYNPNSSVAYIQVYNTASGSVTVGTTSPSQSYGIPPTNSSGYTLSLIGDQYGTAISVAATTLVANSTAPSSALDCNASFN